MAGVIWKHSLEVTHFQKLKLRERSEVLSVQFQNGNLCLWEMAPVGDPLVERSVWIIGTGHVITEQPEHGPAVYGPLNYIGTVQQGVLVWHLFTDAIVRGRK